MIKVRAEHAVDAPAIRAVNESAFGQPDEADLVDSLRETCPEGLSWVAVEEDLVVGHILFTPVKIESMSGILNGYGLAPMAVVPERQGQGIGSRLVEKGLEELQQRSTPFVVVLGHPEYYPRFGFKQTSSFGIRSQWDGVPDEVFMILAFDSELLDGVTGVARYRPEFG